VGLQCGKGLPKGDTHSSGVTLTGNCEKRKRKVDNSPPSNPLVRTITSKLTEGRCSPRKKRKIKKNQKKISLVTKPARREKKKKVFTPSSYMRKCVEDRLCDQVNKEKGQKRGRSTQPDEKGESRP